MKKIILLFVVVLSAFCAVSCKKDNKTTVGILLTATHSALNDAKDGFIEALKANGYEDAEFVVRNPEGDATTMNSMATELVRKSDIVLGVGTPAAVALQSARDAEELDVTILFTAVTDPVSAGLMDDVNKPTDITGTNDMNPVTDPVSAGLMDDVNKPTDITGTNDMNPVADQVDLILELAPGIKKLGVLYNVAETNSQVQAEMVKAQAALKDVEVVVKTVSEAIEISAATTALIQTEKVEAIYIPTDNLMASNMPAIAAVSDELKVPTVCGEAGMVAAGGTITYSINYKSLGYLTGEMAAKILSGTPCSEVPSTSVDASGLEVAINDTSIQNIGIEVPQSIKDKLSK